jgi:nucleotide-binding universal stress UspA family protein
MSQIRRILFPTDFSDCAEATLPHALFLAESLPAELHLLNALVLQEFGIEDPAALLVPPEEIEEKLAELSLPHLEKVRAAGARRQLTILEAQKRGRAPGPVILDYASEHDIDMIVMGTHGRRGLRRFFLGGVAQEVVRLAPCPVLTARDAAQTPVDKIDRIVVPVDYSDACRTAIAWARTMAASYGADIELLHVAEPHYLPYQYGAAPMTAHTTGLGEQLQEARESLQRFAEQVPEIDETWERSVTSGRPASEIVQFTEQGRADLIVIASHGLTGVDRLLLGSTTEEVVRTSPVPVLTVRGPVAAD